MTDWELDEALDLIEEIECGKLKRIIFGSLGYLDNKTISKQIEKDTIHINYSVALSDLLETLNELLDNQFKKSK